MYIYIPFRHCVSVHAGVFRSPPHTERTSGERENGQHVRLQGADTVAVEGGAPGATCLQCKRSRAGGPVGGKVSLAAALTLLHYCWRVLKYIVPWFMGKPGAAITARVVARRGGTCSGTTRFGSTYNVPHIMCMNIYICDISPVARAPLCICVMWRLRWLALQTYIQ